MTDRHSIEAGPDQVNQRLDRFLSAHLEIPRNQIQNWIRQGRILIQDRATKPSHALAVGEIISWEIPAAIIAHDIEPEEGELSILFEDRDIAILDKPAGLVVHPGAGQERGTLVHRLLAKYPEMAATGGPNRPGIVHRLDKDTTGVMVVTRSPVAYQALSRAFSERNVDKRYLAAVYGTPKQVEGIIDQPIGRHPHNRKEMTIRPDGRPARTTYVTIKSFAGLSLLELDLATGRTHQIRVHLKSIGHPIVGDPTYGEARWKALPKAIQYKLKHFSRPALHAWKLQFDHPTTGNKVQFTAAPPDDLVGLWESISPGEFPLPTNSLD